MRKTLYILFVALLTIANANAQTGNLANYGAITVNPDPEAYDRLLADLKQRNSEECYKLFQRDFIEVDIDMISSSSNISDETYAKRLKMMATEIQLPYNDIVKKYIHVYTRPNATMNRVLGLGQYYFPMIESALHKYNLPMELKMLPVIESALIARAVSRAAAVGLWQFMLPTAKYYGLEINSFVDERQDPIKSTDAACRFLQDLYKIYGDWTLVIAAYNCGPGNVNKAIRRVPNAQSYWDIWEYLPRETRNYVPIFIAASYAYTFHKTHGLEPAPTSIPLATDTVEVNRMIHLDQVATTLNIPSDVIRELNPQYIRDIIPATNSTYKLILPLNAASQFGNFTNDIYAKDSIYLGKYSQSDNLKKEVSQRTTVKSPRKTYTVKSGDTLGHIASRNKVSVKDLQKWNSIKGAALRIGQTIVIY